MSRGPSAPEQRTPGTETASPTDVVGRVDARFRIAAWLVIAQGVVMELGALLALPVLVATGLDQDDVGDHFSFALPYLQNNLYLLMIMSGIFGTLRVLGGVGILCDRLWGLGITLVMCVVTLVLMVFMLPAGIADGVLSGGALVLIAFAWFGSRPISTRRCSER